MKIDNNLEIVRLCPSDSPEKVVVLPREERFARTDVVGPIPDRDAHVIESKNKYNDAYTDMLGWSWGARTHPAPAIALKSSSVIHVSQC